MSKRDILINILKAILFLLMVLTCFLDEHVILGLGSLLASMLMAICYLHRRLRGAKSLVHPILFFGFIVTSIVWISELTPWNLLYIEPFASIQLLSVIGLLISMVAYVVISVHNFILK